MEISLVQKEKEQIIIDGPEVVDYILNKNISNVDRLIEKAPFIRLQLTKDIVNDNQIVKLITEFVDTLDFFIDNTSSLFNLMKMSDVDLGYIQKDLYQLQMELLSILKVLQKHNLNRDHVALCDLLEHELTDNLKLWKINILHPMKIILKEVF